MIQQPIIELNHVIKEFASGGGFGTKDAFRALNDISFQLYTGKTLALVGESGCGKSTCAKLITKVHDVTQGQILFKGENINNINLSIYMHDYYRTKKNKN